MSRNDAVVDYLLKMRELNRSGAMGMYGVTVDDHISKLLELSGYTKAYRVTITIDIESPSLAVARSFAKDAADSVRRNVCDCMYEVEELTEK